MYWPSLPFGAQRQPVRSEPIESRLAGNPHSGTCMTEYLPQNTVGYAAGCPPDPAVPFMLSTMKEVPSHEIV